jgi:hypothetical protein
MENTYLTEDKLYDILKLIYPDEEIIRDKKIPDQKNLCRPDFRLPNLKLIFEFDGYNHYTTAKRVVNDHHNDLFYESLGYKVIRIPYFIQLNREFYKNILNIDRDDDYIYKNGFIDDKVVLPADFCSLGVARFNKDVNGRFLYCKDEIAHSLYIKYVKLGNRHLVYSKDIKVDNIEWI